MEHESLFMREIVVVFGTALLAAWSFRIIRAPTIIGFLAAGMFMGPSGLGLVREDDVAAFREIGLILLLFVIGLELSPKPLFRMGKSLLLAAVIQIFSTAAAVAVVVALFGKTAVVPALIIGFAVSLSSTAIVLKQLSDRGETDTVVGMICTGILLLQDVAVLALMLALPVFGAVGDESQDLQHTAFLFCVGVGVVAALSLFGRRLLAVILARIIVTGGRELTALFAVFMACGGAWLAGLVGWSPALGACIAGLLLAEVDARHQLAADIMPFRDVFNALFFVSLGMMVDFDVVVAHFPMLAAAILITLLVKSVIVAVSVRSGGWPMRLALQVAFCMCSVSEFGYVLGLEAARVGILSDAFLDLFSAYAVGTMLLGAMVVPAAAPLSQALTRRLLAGDSTADQDPEDPRANHVILVGYGISGQNLVRVLSATHIDHCLVEMNPSLIQRARKDGVQVVVGDATRMSILEHAGLTHAHALVIAINDPLATARIVSQARAARHDLFILARTRFIDELDALHRAGATRVISEDFETSIESVAQVLKEMDIPDNIIEAQVTAIRAGNYAMLRGRSTDRAAQAELMAALQTTATRTHFIGEASPVLGQTIATVNLRALTGVTIIAVVSNSIPNTNPGPDFVLQSGDVMILVGAHIQLESAKALLESPPTEESTTETSS
jgi:monovalent cation:H+ antiporter-2, CPA2 family